MTPKERARWIVDHYRHIGPEDSQAIMSDIETAIEEDRKARECCKAERDEAIKEIVEIINDVDIHTRKEILEEIDKIRARSDS